MADPNNPGQPQWGPPATPNYGGQSQPAGQPPGQGYPSQPPAGHAPPQQGYAPPPQQGHAPPQQGYAPPQQGYAPPQQQGHAPPQVHAPESGIPGGQPYAPQAPAEPTAPGPGRLGSRSTALPVTVAAGLAVGVFVGLLIVNGTGGSGKGEPDTTGAPVPITAGATDPGKPSGAPATAPDIVALAPADAGVAAKATSPIDAAATINAAAQVAAAAPPDAAVKVVAVPPPVAAKPALSKPAITTVQLTLEVVGPAVAVQRGVKLKVNGKTVTDSTVAIQLKGGKKRVKITASAKGYYYSKRVTLRADKTLSVKLWKLRRKKPSGSSASDLIKLGP